VEAVNVGLIARMLARAAERDGAVTTTAGQVVTGRFARDVSEFAVEGTSR
jgi:hypothetical protein